MRACRGTTIHSGRRNVFWTYWSFRQLSQEIISHEAKSKIGPSWTRELSRVLPIVLVVFFNRVWVMQVRRTRSWRWRLYYFWDNGDSRKEVKDRKLLFTFKNIEKMLSMREAYLVISAIESSKSGIGKSNRTLSRVAKTQYSSSCNQDGNCKFCVT